MGHLRQARELTERALNSGNKILRNPRIVQLSATLPFAKRQLGRSAVMNARDNSARLAQARRAYGSFLDLWKDGDPDISKLKQARAEFA